MVLDSGKHVNGVNGINGTDGINGVHANGANGTISEAGPHKTPRAFVKPTSLLAKFLDAHRELEYYKRVCYSVYGMSSHYSL